LVVDIPCNVPEGLCWNTHFNIALFLLIKINCDVERITQTIDLRRKRLSDLEFKTDSAKWPFKLTFIIEVGLKWDVMS